MTLKKSRQLRDERTRLVPLCFLRDRVPPTNNEASRVGSDAKRHAAAESDMEEGDRRSTQLQPTYAQGSPTAVPNVPANVPSYV